MCTRQEEKECNIHASKFVCTLDLEGRILVNNKERTNKKKKQEFIDVMYELGRFPNAVMRMM